MLNFELRLTGIFPLCVLPKLVGKILYLLLKGTPLGSVSSVPLGSDLG